MTTLAGVRMRNDSGISLSETIEQFRDAMREQGIETKDDIVADGTLHRIHVECDSRGSRNGWYILHYDERPAGQFGCNKRYGDKKFPWQSTQKTAPLTPEEKKAYAERVAKERAEKEAAAKARHEAAAVAANSLWDASHEATDDHPYLKGKGVKSHGLRVGRWEKVNTATGEVRVVSDNALLVPVCDRTRKIHSIQAIFPGKLAAMGNRNKDYLLDGAKRGLFHTIGSKPLAHDGKPVFVLCEGYATGASIHECTDHLTLICFDAGNLESVAKAIYDRMAALGKEAIILIAADNDRWTLTPIENPGVHFAQKAAAASTGIVVTPEFSQETLSRHVKMDAATGRTEGPTDFNDLHQLEGADAVVRLFDVALNPPEETQPEPAPDPQPEPNSSVEDDDFEDQIASNGYFKILGYDEDEYFFFHHGKGQVLVRTARSLSSDVGLIELAPINWWEEHFPGEKGIDKKAACNWIFRTADSRGIYDPTRVRGRGAWVDNGRSVYHHGDMLTVDGTAVDLTRIKSAYVYPKAQKMPRPAANMLTAEEGRKLLDVAKMVRWSKPGSAALLAGWTMLAPICGALKWRPHIWITGAAGSGKSTVQNQFCAALTRDIGVYAQGESTEAGIRQVLKGDARPVLMDEAESNDEKSKTRIEAILATIRQASTESQAQTLKGTVSGKSMRFVIRSMFCLASINTNLGKKADIDRLTRLTVRPPARDGSSEEHWQKLKDELYAIDNNPELSGRLLARALKLLPNIIANIQVFTRVAAKIFGTQREGDQLGTLMAGAWVMCSDDVATAEQAEKMIARYDWTEHTEDSDQDDATRALGDVLDAKIRVGTFGDLSVYELIRECSARHKQIESLPTKEADATLRRHGMIVNLKEGAIVFGTGISALKELISKSSYATDLRGQLVRIPGATRHQNPLKFNGHSSKCVSIPLAGVLDDDTDDTPPI